MVQIIEENRRPQSTRPPSMADRFKNAFATGIDVAGKTWLSEQEREQSARALQEENDFLRENYGIDISGLRGDLRKPAFEKLLEHGMGKEKREGERKEKIAPYQAALRTIQDMKKIRKKGNLGILSGIKGIYNSETLKDQGDYETAGNSLIQFASNIPIRNKIEFEKLAGHLSDPSITDARAEGILNRMEKIIRNSLSQYGEEEEIYNAPENKKRPLSHFEG